MFFFGMLCFFLCSNCCLYLHVLLFFPTTVILLSFQGPQNINYNFQPPSALSFEFWGPTLQDYFLITIYLSYAYVERGLVIVLITVEQVQIYHG